MKLYYYHSKNFGDALNGWLWPRLLPELLDNNESALLVGIGTLLNNDLPAAAVKYVFGSGVGYGASLPTVDTSWQIYCVRGPLSAQALGVDSKLAITDGAVLLRLLNLPRPAKRYRVSYIPHWESTHYWDWQDICKEANIHYINPETSTECVLEEIQASEIIITEAMHGAILADAFRVPWISVRAYKHISAFKWSDWCASLSINYHPVSLPSMYKVNKLLVPPHIKNARYVQANNRPVKRLAARLISDLAATPLIESYKSAVGAAAGSFVRPYNERLAAQTVTTLRQLDSQVEPTLSSDTAIDRATIRLAEKLDQLKVDLARYS